MTIFPLESITDQVFLIQVKNLFRKVSSKGGLYITLVQYALLILIVCMVLFVQKDLASDVLYRLLPFLLMGIGQLMVLRSFFTSISCVR